ncbi:hypothetical protein Pres01_20730 [Metapseudomonas resinovorans]|nr:hypothetical protein Pres01_20730 [Pseudomonas resinovorans]
MKVYAFCLMTNHVDLLLAPDDSIVGLSQLLKTFPARTTRYRALSESRCSAFTHYFYLHSYGADVVGR